MIADFERELTGVAYLYTSTSISTLPIVNYLWEVRDANSGELIASLNGSSNTFLYAWPYSGDFNVTLTITDSGANIDDKTKLYEDQIAIIGGGGAAPSEGMAGQRRDTQIEIIINKVYFEKTKEEVPIKIKIFGGVKLE